LWLAVPSIGAAGKDPYDDEIVTTVSGEPQEPAAPRSSVIHPESST
jgi:hypothetical protein